MPPTAIHATAGVMDLTDGLFVPEIGGTTRPPGIWEAVYKVRPRAPLTWRECGRGLHAKVSDRGMRFFAHDRHAPATGVGPTAAR